MHFPVPDPKRSQIAQACSGSGHPDAPSPSLLTIAPELRNQIYEYLLVDPDPITIENTTVDYTKTKAAKGIPTSVQSPAVIRTCRQIYHEAVGLLYSRNAFRFNYNLHFDETCANTFTSPIEVCKEWIDGIGSCLPRLRTITINMDIPEIPDDAPWQEFYEVEFDVRHDSRQCLNVLPLLDVFWNSDVRNTSVILERADNDASDDYDSESEEPDLDVTLFANVLSELGKMDALDLRKTRRLLEGIYVNTTGTQGTIAYRSTSSNGTVRCKFGHSVETQRYDIVALRSPPTLFNLPGNITDAIIWLALEDQKFTYNFHTGVTNGTQPGMLNVNSQLRKLVAPSFLCKSRSTMILGTNSLHSTKTMFEKLDRRVAEYYKQTWSSERDPPTFCNPVSATTCLINAPTIVLQFQTNESPHLATVHIDAWDLLRVTAIFPARTTITVRVCGDRGELRDHTTTLGDIRKNAYLLLKHLKPELNADACKLGVKVELDRQCIPMQIAFRKSVEGPHLFGLPTVKSLDTTEFTSLFDKGNPTWWNKVHTEHDLEFWAMPYWPEETGNCADWYNLTLDAIISRLYYLCD
ncbi:uncharacterized protein J4E88_008456 [Alternaria novae-zelandiae]|uniref:uncharacterized protein n=1 Tax=Alternaria novae-zelandiae TaxID=430562 RepID=UPI0020C1C7B6|nr:uncharacterized protein J4E88_008456 [Alternaria novae-zelandiae]KAI4673989.1 hypothetical protein J4E88_008456 [Alternaria novae-zelandiae]